MKPDRELVPLGDRAFLAHFPDEAQAAAWANSVRQTALPGLAEVVVAYRSVSVVVAADCREIEALGGLISAVASRWEQGPSQRLHVLPVLYDGADLPDVARLLGCSSHEVVARHCRPVYRVFAIGFQPGFPYAGPLPEDLAGLPRRSSPRARVPAGSVAIAGRQTGVYPASSPGGWHLLGRCPCRIVDMAERRFPIQAGDQIRFEPVDARRFEQLQGLNLWDLDSST